LPQILVSLLILALFFALIYLIFDNFLGYIIIAIVLYFLVKNLIKLFK
jgi:predicted PurR-regulated permease PerM